MKATEVKSMPVEELNAKLDSLKEELFALRFQLAANQLENTLVENLTLNCGAGEQKILYQSDKPLAISGIWLLADEKQCDWEDLEKLRMEIYWDGEKEKSVSCSLAAFFGVIKESCEYHSWPVSKTERECAAFWYMPCKSVIIKIINNVSHYE